jgi:glyoxylase-like metal-dependent hydrolase (beta-lactamase superfamily II)/ferredoxin
MASPKRRLVANVAGEFYVDASCIDCGTCRGVAPASFADGRDSSYVYRQHEGDAEIRRAEMALIACPTGSIGTRQKHSLAAAEAAFPERIDGPVYHCGYHARASFGAASYLIVRPEGNVLVDSPRFTEPLVHRLEALGGVTWMFLTHRDDVADHRRFRQHFGCTRILHADDITRDTRDVEMPLAGRDQIRLADDLLVIPVPGHTKGSACLLHRETHLFSGDHLAGDPDRQRLTAFRDACWYDWDELRRSMGRLAAHAFEWVLPGHGRRIHFPASMMRMKMRECIASLT